ncbi:hypothetical protein KOR34_50850 [Posidoniimonas corsicana]|uniref:DUF3826 domain-containing protein n=2 Tax=Posidoniimonas corsicana TaxID=1938618 RepID=A0A5C5UW34_9BACT|nr:hypothetical protein KOR34_50850 [Posidoniimonas corsicana]
MTARRRARRLLLSVMAAFSLAGGANAAQDLSPEEAEYRKVIRGRAEKIVEQLDLTDREQAERVIVLVADYYRGLRDNHDERDAQLSSADEDQRQSIRNESQLAVQKLHRQFVAAISAEVSPEQVGQVKDGLTYGVVDVTLGAYKELLPDLTDEELRYIRANLIEAREYAMDGGSSREKHGWFGKYKGRINNYLSAHGYDLKQAEHELADRKRRAAAANQAR